MVDRNIVGYDDVNRIMGAYYLAGGPEGLPPELSFSRRFSALA